jgi:hypothetical protein
VRALVRPALPALVVAILVFGVARWIDTDTLLELALVGAAWCGLATSAVWRLGLTADERRSFTRQIGLGGAAAVPYDTAPS